MKQREAIRKAKRIDGFFQWCLHWQFSGNIFLGNAGTKSLSLNIY